MAIVLTLNREVDVSVKIVKAVAPIVTLNFCQKLVKNLTVESLLVCEAVKYDQSTRAFE